jgi:hypothetical protein
VINASGVAGVYNLAASRFTAHQAKRSAECKSIASLNKAARPDTPSPENGKTRFWTSGLFYALYRFYALCREQFFSPCCRGARIPVCQSNS